MGRTGIGYWEARWRIREGARDALPPSVQGLLDKEQRLLNRDVDTREIRSPKQNRQRRRFRPERGATFPLPTYWISASKLEALYGQGLSPELQRFFVRKTPGGETQYRLIVHPESRRFYRHLLEGAEPAGHVLATPTSSARTLLVWDPDAPERPFFAKLSLNRTVGYVKRTIPRSEVARSIGVNNVLSETAPGIDGFDYAPEVLGLMPRGMPRGGMIVREIPDEVLDGQVELVPLFSLYTSPGRNEPPLLAKWIAESGEAPGDYIRTTLLEPFARQWFDLMVNHGISNEPHAQNSLLARRDGGPSGFFHRDLGGFDLHLEHRKALGHDDSERLPVLGTLVGDYHQEETSKHFRNLKVFFVGGFLFNVEKALPGWVDRGWVRGPCPPPYMLQCYLAAELSKQHEQLTGEPFPLSTSLNDVESLIRSARQFLVET